MKVSFSPRSLRQLEDIHAYVQERNPRAAREVVSRIEELCGKLGDFPGMGTRTEQPDVRMLPVVRYPYIILYTILADRDEVRILRIRHGARRPEPLRYDERKG